MKKILAMLAVIALSCGPTAYAKVELGVTTVSTYTGADAGEGLDLDGDIYWAVDSGWTGTVGAGGGTIRDATFTQPSITDGFSQSTPDYGIELEDSVSGIEYGSSANDEILEEIADNIFRGKVNITVSIYHTLNGYPGYPITPGKYYKLQVGLHRPSNDKCWDIFVRDNDTFGELGMIADNLTIKASQNSGTVLTYTFQPDAGDGDWIRVYIARCDWYGDTSIPEGYDVRYPSINFITLEELPDPSTCQDIIDIGAGLPTDLNEDCHVDLGDVSLLAGDWLRCFDPNEGSCP